MRARTGCIAVAILAGVALTSAPAAISSSSGELVPFTQQELDDNWVPDRRAPSGGYESVGEFEGRSDVANIGIDSSAAAGGTFNRTEGIKKMEDFGSDRKLGVDLYIDPAWQDTAVRAGLWLAGWDSALAPDGQGRKRTGEFAMIDFTTAQELFAPPLAGPVDKDERWRVWHSTGGWVDLPAVPVTYGEWVTLEIELVLDNDDRYDYFINGELVHSASNAAFSADHVGEVILNHYNYGSEDMAAGFNNDDYEVHWHIGVEAEPPFLQDLLDQFCRVLPEIQTVPDQLAALFGGVDLEDPDTYPSAEAVEAFIGEVSALLEAGDTGVPPTVAPQWSIATAELRELVSGLTAVGFDFGLLVDLSPEDAERIVEAARGEGPPNPEFDAAVQVLTDWFLDNCLVEDLFEDVVPAAPVGVTPLFTG